MKALAKALKENIVKALHVAKKDAITGHIVVQAFLVDAIVLILFSIVFFAVGVLVLERTLH